MHYIFIFPAFDEVSLKNQILAKTCSRILDYQMYLSIRPVCFFDIEISSLRNFVGGYTVHFVNAIPNRIFVGKWRNV